jgi:hypothetical protein
MGEEKTQLNIAFVGQIDSTTCDNLITILGYDQRRTLALLISYCYMLGTIHISEGVILRKLSDTRKGNTCSDVLAWRSYALVEKGPLARTL